MSVDGATPLRTLIGAERLEQHRALTIARKVVAAIADLHGAGKTHGNISPDTILVAARPGDDVVELRDAGAKGAKDPVYCPAGPADARADLYAAGVVLFEMLAGRPPFAADDAEGLRRLHAYAPRQTLQQRAPEGTFAPEAEAVVATAIAQQRDGRFKDAKSMLESIDRALAAVPKPAPGPSAPSPPGPGEPPKIPSVQGEPPPLDPSLLLLAQDLMPAQEVRQSEPAMADNVGREVPRLPWYSQLELRVRRMPRKQLAGAGVVAVLALIAVIAMCSGSSKKTKGSPDAATKAGAAAEKLDLDARCDQLAKGCGDTDKHVAKILEDCKAAAVRQRKHGCEPAVKTAYDCYETKLCADKKIWALDDFRVLSTRNKQCVAETSALHACSK